MENHCSETTFKRRFNFHCCYFLGKKDINKVYIYGDGKRVETLGVLVENKILLRSAREILLYEKIVRIVLRLWMTSQRRRIGDYYESSYKRYASGCDK